MLKWLGSGLLSSSLSVNVPVQSAETEYVPVVVPDETVPLFSTVHNALVTFPCPSKVNCPVPILGPSTPPGLPWEYPKTPFRLASEQVAAKAGLPASTIVNTHKHIPVAVRVDIALSLNIVFPSIPPSSQNSTIPVAQARPSSNPHSSASVLICSGCIA